MFAQGKKPALSLHLTPKTCAPLPTTASSSTYATLNVLPAYPKHTALQFRVQTRTES